MSSYQPETHALYRESNDTAAQMVQVALLVATLLAQRAVEARERRYAMEQAAAEERAQVAAEQLRAQRAAAEPVLRAVHQERFWKNPDARRIGRAWQAASEWADGDPYAAHTLEFLREQLRERFGIEAPAWPVHGAELSRIVTLADPAYRKHLDAAREAAEKAGGSTSYAFIVRDARDPYRVLYQGEAKAPVGMPAATAAAREFEVWAQGAGADSVKGRDRAEFTIEAMENNGTNRAGQVPAAEVHGNQVSDILAADVAWQRALIEGAESGSPGEMLYAYGGELERLEEEEKFRRARRAEYAARLEGESLSDADRKRLSGNVTALDTGLKALHQQQADNALKMAASAAELRGEAAEYVFRAARLQDSLDEGWWATASAAEVSGVWEHVTAWEPGQAREDMCQMLREEIERHHRLSIPRDATADMVAALYGGREAPGVATPISARGNALREQAQAVYESAFDLQAEALTVEGAVTPGWDGWEESGAAARLADSLRARAEAEAEVASQLIEQATWLDAQTPEVMSRLYAENSGDAVRSLVEQFEQQWGQSLTPEARQELTSVVDDLTEGRSPWTVAAGAGSADPVAVPAVTVPAGRQPESEERPQDADAETEDADTPLGLPREDEEALKVEARHRAAEALDSVADQEAAEAARVTLQAFPEDAQAATAVAPASRRAPGGKMPEPARQKAPTLGL
ncbi:MULTISPECIES: hypothetical protein [unclassified Streptomyces]|uniref:hypothetical protein n=1 Tax=unclassified Streptomyces TaxID=2593676 RepID=UPI0033FD688A